MKFRLLSMVVLGIVSVLLSSCNADGPTEPRVLDLEPAFFIQDGSHNEGSEGFYWLPPMVTPAPSFGGTFNVAADPVVTACRLNGSACSETVRTFTLNDGLQASLDEEWFGADWFIFEDMPQAEDGEVYRLLASESGQVLGVADVMIVDKATGKLRKDSEDDYLLMSVMNGRPFLPIRFRMEAQLLALYALDGNADDSSGHGYDGVVLGAVPTTDRFGSTGGAMLLDGVDDYLDMKDQFDAPAAITLTAWIQVAPAGDDGDVIIQKRVPDGLFSFDFTVFHGTISEHPCTQHGQVNLVLDPDGDRTDGDTIEVCSTTNVADGNWHHVAATVDGATARIYIDGQEESTVPFPYPIPDSDGDLTIGKRPERVHAYFEGAIDEVRVYSGALSASQIGELCDVPVICSP